VVESFFETSGENMNYSYNEYIKLRKENMLKIINQQISLLSSNDGLEEVLYDVLDEYQYFLNEEILTLYKKAGMNVEVYDIYTNIYEVKDKEIRRKILMLIEEFQLIFSIINLISKNYLMDVKENKTIDDILFTIDYEKRREIVKMIEDYENLYNEKIKFVDSGTVTNVFSVGSKIIKFGPMRRYLNIPYCLEIEESIQYSDHLFCYVTEKIDTNNCTIEDAYNMYFLLRDNGYVWIDVKGDNLGTKNGKIKILDDIDIFSVEDIYKKGKHSVLDFLSTNLRPALLEIDWLSRQTDNFDVDSINQYFNDETKTQLIERLKDEYVKITSRYNYDLEAENCTYISLLGKKIEEINLVDDGISR